MPEQNYDLIAAQLNETLGGSDTAIRLNESEVYRLLQGCGVRVCPSVFLPLDADAPRRAEPDSRTLDGPGRTLGTLTTVVVTPARPTCTTSTCTAC